MYLEQVNKMSFLMKANCEQPLKISLILVFLYNHDVCIISKQK